MLPRKKTLFKQKEIVLFVTSAVTTSGLWINNAIAEETYLFDEMVVSATKTEQQITDVAVSVDLVTEKDIENKLAQDLEQAVSGEPGVSMLGVGRYGQSGFAIRGLSENYVKTVIDGVEQPASYNPDHAGGAFGAGNVMRKYNNNIETDTLQRIEINKGPSSSLYGSDALAGAVIIRTKNPSDLLPESGDATVGGIKTGYYGVDDSYKATITVANRYQDVESLLIYTHRQGHETKTHSQGADISGKKRGRADPFDIASDNLLLKLYYQANEMHRFGLTGEIFNQDAEGLILSKDGTSAGPGFTYSNNRADDRNNRARVSLEHQWQLNAIIADQLKWQYTYLESEAFNNTFDTTDRLGQRKRERYGFDQSHQFDLQLNKAVEISNVFHELSYGMNWVENEFDLNYQDVNLDTGEIKNKAGEVPQAKVNKWGLFVQDQAFLLDETLVVNAGIRYDSYHVKPKGETNHPESKSRAVTGKLGSVYHWTDSFSTYANISQGFKSPTVQDLYFYYGYGSIYEPNPNLKPEESIGYETGFRFNTELSSTHISLYYNDYSNFIDLKSLGVIDGKNAFTKENISEAHIYGAEFKTDLALDGFGLPQGMYTRASIAYAKGKNGQTGRGIDSVAPLTAGLTLGYNHPNQYFGTEIFVQSVAKKSGNDWADSHNINAPGYTKMDITAYYEPIESMTIRGGIFNVSDKKYWDYADLSGADNSQAGIDRHTQPGRHFGIEVEYDF